MKITPTNICRLISECISENFRKSQNKKPTIVKDRIGFKLNLGIISFRLCRKENLIELTTQLNLGILQFEWSREWSSLSGKNATFSGDAGSKPALHSFFHIIHICLFSPRLSVSNLLQKGHATLFIFWYYVNLWL